MFQVHIIVASVSDPHEGRSVHKHTEIVELYVDDQPTLIIRVLNADDHTATGPPYFEAALWAGISDGYGQLTIASYATSKDLNQVHPEGIVWYDDMVVSRVHEPALSDPPYGRTNRSHLKQRMSG